MKAITNYRELKNELMFQSEDGPLCGWIIFNGEKMFVSKHWSYDGGYPVYESDEIGAKPIGDLICDKNWFPWIVDGVQQKEHGCWDLFDCKMILQREN